MRIELAASRFCNYLAPADVELIRTSGRACQLAPGAEVFREGDPGDGLYILLEGAVDIVSRLASGKIYVLSHMDAGDYFGEMAVFDGEPRSATALVREAVDLIFVPVETVQKLVERSPLVGAMLVRDASLRLREFNQRFLRESLRGERLALVERLARSIVHDFRGPLNIIGLAGEMAAAEGASLEARREAAQRIQKYVGVLNRMMQELVDFTRGSPTNVVLPKVNYADFLRDTLLDLQAASARRGVRFVVEGELPRVRLRMDTARFARVFMNLSQNSFDAMADQPNPTLTMRFRLSSSHVVTELQDNGKGIEAQYLPRLFEPFFTHGKEQGTGLGLPICERIVHDHGGKITAFSTPGQGATFSVVLPLPSPGDTETIGRPPETSATSDTSSDIHNAEKGPGTSADTTEPKADSKGEA